MNKNINKSSYYCLLVLKFILANTIFTLDDILLFLEENHHIFIYNETVLKYIRTLKFVGFKFKKINNKTYQLIELPFKLDLSSNEVDVINKCITHFKNLSIMKNSVKDIRIFEKISMLIENTVLESKKPVVTDEKLDEFQKFCVEKLRLNIEYRYKNKICYYQVEPDELILFDNIIYLKCYNISDKNNMLLEIENIIQVKQTPVKNKFKYSTNIATLKFSLDIAKSYTIKENEKVIKEDDTGLYIQTVYYDKEMFFKHILRYMDKCEITFPQVLRKEFKEYVEELYQIYYCPS